MSNHQVKHVDEQDNVPAEYEPISAWGYLGYEILFAIPVIGWIFLIFFAIGADNVNLRNFARSYFCIWIIAIIVVIAYYAAIGMGVSLPEVHFE